MTSQREPCHEGLGVSQPLSRTVALSFFDGFLMSASTVSHGDLCALELGQKTYKTTKIKHYYQCIAWEQVEPIPNQH